MGEASEPQASPESSRRSFIRRMAVAGVALGVPAVSSFSVGACHFLGDHDGGGNTSYPN